VGGNTGNVYAMRPIGAGLEYDRNWSLVEDYGTVEDVGEVEESAAIAVDLSVACESRYW
jgi:hypothetical protein